MENQENHLSNTWHKKHAESLTAGQRLADKVAGVMGSWAFITFQTTVVTLWIVLNVTAYFLSWDPYPFILLNLLFSTQAAYAAPVIMMSQNRQNERDRAQALADFETNLRSEKEIEQLKISLSRMETEKLDQIIRILKEKV